MDSTISVSDLSDTTERKPFDSIRIVLPFKNQKSADTVYTERWLAELVECQSAVRVRDPTGPTLKGLKITGENLLRLQLYLQMVRCSVFSDKDNKL